MAYSIPSAALGLMSEVERSRFLDAALGAPPEVVNEYILVLDARLRVFEARYELRSAELHEALASHHLPETAEISRWLFLAVLREHLAKEARA